MEAALGWLGDIIRAILRVVPRLQIVRATHGGVKFVRGKHVKVMKPGLHIWWPLVTEIQVMPIVKRTLQIPGVALTRKDGKTYVITIAIVYTIKDVKKAITNVAFVGKALEDIFQGIVLDEAVEEQENLELLKCNIWDAAYDEMLDLGVDVSTIYIVDYSKVLPIRMFNEFSQGETE